MGIKNSLAIGLALASFTMSNAQGASENQETTIKTAEKSLTENFTIMSHKEIITTKISDLIVKYWREKTQELVRENALIEINKYKNWEKYKINYVLNTSAQNHADDMSKNNYFDHKNREGKHVWDRIATTDFDYKYLWENISNDNNISNVVMSYVKSKKWWHEDIFNEKYENIGIWICPVIDQNLETSKYYFVFDFGKTF